MPSVAPVEDGSTPEPKTEAAAPVKKPSAAAPAKKPSAAAPAKKPAAAPAFGADVPVATVEIDTETAVKFYFSKVHIYSFCVKATPLGNLSSYFYLYEQRTDVLNGLYADLDEEHDENNLGGNFLFFFSFQICFFQVNVPKYYPFLNYTKQS